MRFPIVWPLGALFIRTVTGERAAARIDRSSIPAPQWSRRRRNRAARDRV